jgi:UDP-glucose 4-epimerase
VDSGAGVGDRGKGDEHLTTLEGSGHTTPPGSHLFSGASVLITGGVGFIGSNLARRLVAMGARVILMDSMVPVYGGNLFNVEDLKDQVTVNISDVRDVHSMEHLVRGVDYLFNLAGQTSHLDSMVDPFTDLDINCTSQLHILESCRKYNQDAKLVFASTRQFYGRPQYLPVDEKHPLHPVDVNGINKLAGEAYHVLYHEVHDLKTVCLRLTNTYGPGMRVRDARQTFLGIWIRRVLEDEPFEVWEGEQLRDLTFVDDAVDAMLQVATTPEALGQVLNVGGPPPVSLAELAEIVVKANGGGSYEVRKFPEDQKRIDIGSFYADFTEIHNLTGWDPRVGVEDGVRRTLDFYREHLAHYV